MQYENMWQEITGETFLGSTVTHIIPMHDMFSHYLCKDCWCQPDLDDSADIAMHHSADGRELFEMGIRKPS